MIVEEAEIAIKVVGAFFIVTSCIGMLCSIFLLLTFIIYSSTRKSPGDTLLALSMTDFFQCFVFFINAIYWIAYVGLPDINKSFCRISSFISISSYCANVLYSFWFCIQIITIIKGSLIQKKKIKYLIHAVILIISILPSIMILATDQVGINMYGICSKKSKGDIWSLLDAIAYLVNLTTVFKTYKAIKNQIPQQSKFTLQKLEMCKYYSKYVKVIRILIFFKFLFSILIVITFITFSDQDINNLNVLLILILILFYIAILTLAQIQPVLLALIRLQDPIVKPKLKRMIAYLKRQKHVKDIQNDQNWYALLKANIQCTLLNTILYGLIEINNPNRQTSKKMDVLIIESRDSILEMKVYKYFPLQYDNLIQKDKLMVNILESFNPENNQEQIQQFQTPDGGKSGQFFFFTKDQKLMMKTITNEELETLIEMNEQYHKYIQGVETTLLSIIYGIYTFQRYDIESDPIHIIIQRNISQINSNYIDKIYDLKGSDLAREVKINENKLIQTLKDKNFEILEGQIKIEDQMKEILSKTIEQDVGFLQDLGFMDYSLLVIKVNYNKYCKDYNLEIQTILNRFSNQIFIIQAIDNEDLYYHIGIIDYLQKWNIQKKMEKTSKMLIYGDQNQSAVDPTTYAQRFIRKIVKQYIQN